MQARHKTVAVDVGGVMVGGGHPIVVQSMTNTDTADVEGTAQQVAALARAGSELVRITVDTISAVSVFVIDCTATGASPPTSTLPIRTCRVARRGAGPNGMESDSPAQGNGAFVVMGHSLICLHVRRGFPHR